MKDKVQLLDLPRIVDKRGVLSFFESQNQISFDIHKTTVVNEVSKYSDLRYSFRKQQELIIVLHGSVDIFIKEDGSESVYSLDCPNKGLYIGKLIGRRFEEKSTNSILLITASETNNEEYS